MSRIIWRDDADLPWELGLNRSEIEVKNAIVLDAMVCFTFERRYWRVPLASVSAIDVEGVVDDDDDAS